jgi:hypothetical protein
MSLVWVIQRRTKLRKVDTFLKLVPPKLNVWYVPIILALRWLRQEDFRFEAELRNEIMSQKIKNKKNERKKCYYFELIL